MATEGSGFVVGPAVVTRFFVVAHESSQHNSVHCSQQVHSRKSSRHFLLVGVPFSGSFAGESRQKKENGGSRRSTRMMRTCRSASPCVRSSPGLLRGALTLDSVVNRVVEICARLARLRFYAPQLHFAFVTQVQAQGALKSNTGAFHPASFFFAGFFAGPTVTRYSFTVAFRVALL